MFRAYLRMLRLVVATACLAASGRAALAQGPAASDSSAVPARPVTGVYRCTENGATVFADRPCGHDAVREGVAADAISSYEPVLPASPAPGSRRRSTSSAAAARPTPAHSPEAAQRVAECRRIGRRLAQLESRMRTGYSGHQGEKLRAEHHQLAGRRYDLRCRTSEMRAASP